MTEAVAENIIEVADTEATVGKKEERKSSSSKSKEKSKEKEKKSSKKKDSKDAKKSSKKHSNKEKNKDSDTEETAKMTNESELSGAVRKSKSSGSKDSKDKDKKDKDKKSKKKDKDKNKDKEKSSKDKDRKKSKKEKETHKDDNNTKTEDEKESKDTDEKKSKKKSKKDKDKRDKKEKKKKDKKEKKKSKDSKNEEDDDAEMRELLEKFVTETGMGDDDDATESSTGLDSSEEDQIARRELDVENNVFDHVVMGAPDIEAAIAEFKDKTGIAPVLAGNVKGLGIKTARVSFDGASFLEIIAPDPEKKGPIGDILLGAGLTGLQPFHWAIRLDDVDDLTTEAEKLGYIADCIGMSASRDDGTRRKWESLFLYGHKLRGMCPFFVNWDVNDHPCETMPVVGNIVDVKITAPDDDLVHKLHTHCQSTGFTLKSGDPHFEFKFDSPRGEVSFSTSKMSGFKFPGVDEGPIGSYYEEEEGTEVDPSESPDLQKATGEEETEAETESSGSQEDDFGKGPDDQNYQQKGEPSPSGTAKKQTIACDSAKTQFMPIPHTVPHDDYDEDDSLYETTMSNPVAPASA